MQESEPPKDAGRKLFGELFGFKVGDRVKKWRRNTRRYWSRSPKGYWKYGIIKRIVSGNYPPNYKRYRVHWDGGWGTIGYSAQELTKVRPYVRRKIKARPSNIRWRRKW